MSVPKLRFPEFRESKEWEDVKLGQLGKLVAGLTYSPEDVRDQGLLVLRSSNVQHGQISLGDNVYVSPDVKGVNLSKPNDILICVRNGSKSLIGKNALIPDKMPLCTHGAFMTVFRSPAAKFVYQLFQTAAYQKQVDGDLGATINSINGSQFVKYKFNIPTLAEEQKKVAACLSSLDDVISFEGSKLETLKNHKQGLIQQLFPSDGESVPRTRFEGFEGDWEEKKLSELATRINQKNKASKVTRVLTNSASGGILDQRDYFDKDIANQNNLDGYYIVDKGDYVYNPRVSTFAPVGPISKNKIGMGVMSPLYSVFRFKSKSNSFYEQYFKTSYWHSYLKTISNCGARHDRMSISVVDFMAMPLPEPFLPEQQKIASCLSSIDDLIMAQAAYITTLKLQKQGLMQQLFPATDEVTA